MFKKPMGKYSKYIIQAGNSFGRTLDYFRRDNKGNIAMIMGFAAIPMIVLAGGAFDYTTAMSARQRITHAIDAAALAAAQMSPDDANGTQQIGLRVFNQNMYGLDNILDAEIVLNSTATKIMATGTGYIETSFLGLIGMNTIAVSNTNEVTRHRMNIELVLALDNTGSMGSGGKMDAMKSAAQELVDIIFNGESNPDDIKIGLVPFSQTVNVGSQYRNASWMDQAGLSSVNGINFNDNTHHFNMFDSTSNGQWGGCVEARPAPFDTTDDVPSTTAPDTLFVPYMAPDEPDIGYGYPNKYLGDQTSGTYDERQKHKLKYQNASVNNNGNSKGPNYLCSPPPITALTNDQNTLVNSINSFQPAGWTHIPLGLSWGWRVLSPSIPFVEGKAYDDPENIKAMVLLTDGENTIAPRNNHNKSYYTAYGYLNRGRLGTTNQYTGLQVINDKTMTLCTNIKAAGIRLYTIAFDLGGNTQVINMMRDCASSPSLFFNSPSSSELQVAFQQIAGDLNKLRLSK